MSVTINAQTNMTELINDELVRGQSDGEEEVSVEEVGDIFRLAIRGHAVLEAKLGAAIAEGFRGDTPSEIQNLPFRIRLALFKALTMLPDKYLDVIKAVARMRNNFAHGQIDELTSEQAAELAAVTRAASPPDFTTPYDSSVIRLAAALIVADSAIVAATHASREIRETEESAVSFRREVEELLRQSSGA
jgi:hypothetical protein